MLAHRQSPQLVIEVAALLAGLAPLRRVEQTRPALLFVPFARSDRALGVGAPQRPLVSQTA
jgi:hypothetical protein